MKLSILVSTHGTEEWRRLALSRAVPSAEDQGAHEVLVLHEPNATLAEVRNANAERATGDYLVFLDGDDELGDGYADATAAAIAKTKKPALFTPAVIYARRNVRPTPKIWPRMDFKVGNWCVIGTAISKDMFTAVGGFREYKLYEDYALWAMAEAKFDVDVVEVPDAIYVAHFNQKSRNRTPGPRERFFWHQQIGADVWPESFEQPTDEEALTHRLSTQYLRRLDA